MKDFARSGSETGTVRRAVRTTGDDDFTLKIACRDQDDLVRIIEHLRERAGIQSTCTRLIGRELLRGGAPGADRCRADLVCCLTGRLKQPISPARGRRRERRSQIRPSG